MELYNVDLVASIPDAAVTMAYWYTGQNNLSATAIAIGFPKFRKLAAQQILLNRYKLSEMQRLLNAVEVGE